ncbi:7525_t:CDS:2 [Entrophospora sp. SA101]|nr:7525_t:CDS:2 [Entrophospora sp. SA101]
MSEWIDEAIKNRHLTFHQYKVFSDVHEIGSGSFGTVYKAYNSNHEKHMLQLHRQVEMHKNIISFYGITKNVAEILGTIDIENIKQKITLESNLMKNIENLSSNALNNSNVEVNDINLETNYSYFQVTSTMEKDVSKISQLILSIMGRDKNQILMYCSGDGQKWDGPYSFFDFNLSSISSVATITNFNMIVAGLALLELAKVLEVNSLRKALEFAASIY